MDNFNTNSINQKRGMDSRCWIMAKVYYWNGMRNENRLLERIKKNANTG